MKSFYIGPDGARLYCNLHMPKTRLIRDVGVILCNPLGHEYYRSYRAYARLADHLAERGFTVMRFDYFGTGDSEGAAGRARFDDWIRDIVELARALRDEAGLGAVVLAGMRFGALAAAYAAREIEDAAGVILWEPFVDGESYVGELDALHRGLLNDLERFPFPRKLHDSAASEFVGHVYGVPFLKDLRRTTTETIVKDLAERSLRVGTVHGGDGRTDWNPRGITVRQHLPHSGYGWSDVSRVSEIIVDPLANRHVAMALDEVTA